jgi:hypothetical protein
MVLFLGDSHCPRRPLRSTPFANSPFLSRHLSTLEVLYRFDVFRRNTILITPLYLLFTSPTKQVAIAF